MAKKKPEFYTPIRFPSDKIDLINIEITRSKIIGRYHLHCKDNIDMVNIYLNKNNTEELLRILDWYIERENSE